MIKFYETPVPTSMQIYNGETRGKDWNDPSYAASVPADWSSNNTVDRIKVILQAKASEFAFVDTTERESFKTVASDNSNEVLVVLKGLHQFKAGQPGSPATAHVTVAWFTYLVHLNIGQNAGIWEIGVAKLGVKSVTFGSKSISSAVTGWLVQK